MPGVERRKFVRHPVRVPLQYSVCGSSKTTRVRTAKDLSVGGIAFQCDDPPPIGSRITVRIDTTDPPFETEAVVVRVMMLDSHFDVGVAFESGQLWFRARMVEQVCHIAAYRQEQADDGRQLSFQEAADEWIQENAATFG